VIRSEIYANRSVEEDILEEILNRIPHAQYSIIEDVKGAGRSGVREGTAVWPELNILYILFSDADEAHLIADAVRTVKAVFPREGIKLFQYELNMFAEDR